jgi:iron complex outermembrane recepter protein
MMTMTARVLSMPSDIKKTITAIAAVLCCAISVFCLLCVTASPRAFAEEMPSNGDDPPAPIHISLDEIVVTASKFSEPVENVAQHVTVITREDIEAAAGENIVDVLAREAGISIRSASGSDRQAVVDLRGMGDTASSNVIVMVDDMPINAPDQSGPSISSIPMEQIERIEIVRGAGSVVYGSGAVGGVINIITRRPPEIPTATIYASAGQHDAYTARAAFAGRVKDVDIDINTGYHDADGYRDNGFFRKKDIGIKTAYPATDRLSLKLSGMAYEDQYGLPGPVSAADVESRSRRTRTDRPDDRGESTEYKARAGVEMDFEDRGLLTVNRGYRFRDNRYIIGYTPLIPRDDQKSRIDEDTRLVDLNYVLHYRAFDRFHMFQFGMDHANTDYIRTENPAGPRKNAQTESIGAFVNNQWRISEQTMINAGLRHHHYQGRFRVDEKKRFDDQWLWVNGEVDRKQWDHQVFSVGATHALSDATSVFTGYAASFRIPNVDEFAESEEGLKPQKGGHIDMGVRQKIGDRLTMTIAIFDIRIDDEIYYSDLNRNYDDKTIRRGVETDLTCYPVDDLRCWGNYTYTEAKFDGSGATIPLVARHRASAGVNWQAARPLDIAVSGTYSGSRYDGNDLTNDRYDKLDAYLVFDAKVTYQYKDVAVFAGVSNIFDELYSTSAYSESHYPMPGRTVFGGIRWTCF